MNAALATFTADELAAELTARLDNAPQAVTFGGGGNGIAGIFGGGILKGLLAKLVSQMFTGLDKTKLVDAVALAVKLYFQGKSWQEIFDAIWASLTTNP